MFDQMKDISAQIQLLQKLMKDEHFKKFLMHPRVQSLMQDRDFTEAVQSKDPNRISNHPKLEELKQDPELRELMSKLDMQKLFG